MSAKEEILALIKDEGGWYSCRSEDKMYKVLEKYKLEFPVLVGQFILYEDTYWRDIKIEKVTVVS